MPVSHTKYKLCCIKVNLEAIKKREKHDCLTLPRTPEQLQASILPTNPLTYKSTVLYYCYEPPS